MSTQQEPSFNASVLAKVGVKSAKVGGGGGGGQELDGALIHTRWWVLHSTPLGSQGTLIQQ